MALALPPFELWMVTAAANVVMVVVYAWIAVIMLKAIVEGKQWTSNPILTATFAIFVTCTFGHGVHLEHALLPWTGAVLAADPEEVAVLGAAARTAFSDPRLLAWDVFTAGVAMWYWTLRSRFAVIYRGAALCEDMAKRQQDAMDLHDNVVQGLTRAKMELDLGRREQGLQAVEETLHAARGIITHLLGEKGSEVELGAGDLRRKKAAGAKG